MNEIIYYIYRRRLSKECDLKQTKNKIYKIDIEGRAGYRTIVIKDKLIYEDVLIKEQNDKCS